MTIARAQLEKKISTKPTTYMLTKVVFASCSSFSFDENAIRKMAPKLRIIATISKGVICSLRKHQPSKEAQKGAVLFIVIYAIRGIRVTL